MFIINHYGVDKKGLYDLIGIHQPFYPKSLFLNSGFTGIHPGMGGWSNRMPDSANGKGRYDEEKKA